MKGLLEYIKFLFCKHSKDVFIRNIHGDEIIFGTPNYSRSQWGCKKCNSKFFDTDLYYPELKNNPSCNK